MIGWELCMCGAAWHRSNEVCCAACLLSEKLQEPDADAPRPEQEAPPQPESRQEA